MLVAGCIFVNLCELELGSMKKQIEWSVDGIHCTSCALTITKYLEKNGCEEVVVNPTTGDVRFVATGEGGSAQLAVLQKGIDGLGYKVLLHEEAAPWWTIERKLLFCAVFTLPLLLHMFIGWHWLHHPVVQLVLTVPVFVVGCMHFGRSALKSVLHGMPNMDVLIFVGSTSAFVYSVWGMVRQLGPDYLFFETAASVITLVLLGNWIEKRAVGVSASAIDELVRLQPKSARKITFDEQGYEVLVSTPVTDLKVGDFVQLNDGDAIPADGVVIFGEALADEHILTGESMPVRKQRNDKVIGGTLLSGGNLKVRITAVGKLSVLSQIIDLVKNAQADKPNMQLLADKISAWFVPAVLVVALLTFVLNYTLADTGFQAAMLRAIAVLVISCPCAMGLATPTAVMVGVGRAAKSGILLKGGKTLETLAQIQQMVFDKTGTLTTGQFALKELQLLSADRPIEEIAAIVYALEQHSTHPIAQSLVKELARAYPLRREAMPKLATVHEEKGKGVSATDTLGNRYWIGTYSLDESNRFDLLLTINEVQAAGICIADDLKPDAKDLMNYLHAQHITPFLLSGDKLAKVADVAQRLDIRNYEASQQPAQKLDRIAALCAQAPTAMVGDGINDAPALARATLGISLSNATQAAIKSAQVVLLNGDMGHLVRAHQIAKHTLRTIQNSLYWAFAYNLVAIPIAAMGWLNPTWGALFMAFSDVVVIGNAIWLRTKKID